MPSPVRFKIVREMLESAAYDLVRINGSHHIFTRDGSDPVSIPVHKNLVKHGYVRRIQKILDAEAEGQFGSQDEAGG